MNSQQSPPSFDEFHHRGGNQRRFKLTQVTCLKRCIQWDYGGALRWICLSVCACVEEYWALSSQMSAEQSLCTITSGHLGPINTASELQLCLFFFVPYCLFIIVLGLFLPTSPLFVCMAYFLVSLTCTVFVFFPSLSHPPRMHTLISFFLPLLLQSCHAFHCLPPLSRSPASAHSYTVWLFFSPAVGGHLASSRPPLSSSCCCCFHSSLLLTLVKTSPPPWAQTTAEPICHSNLSFFS